MRFLTIARKNRPSASPQEEFFRSGGVRKGRGTAGKLPRPNLSNLDAYNDIGVGLDRDDVELLTVPNYLGIYREKLADQDRYSYMPPDGRLWPGGKTP